MVILYNKLLGNTFQYSVIGGARVVVKEVREKEETAGRVGEGLARKSCREFPLVFLFKNQNPLTNWLISTSQDPLNGLQ